jgi:hypothetical protein
VAAAGADRLRVPAHTDAAVTFADATREYEAWLAAALPAPLVAADLDAKHRVLADPADPFPFFRGTYYRWAQHWADAAGPLAAAPRVLAVGDLHVENFGTWRDGDGRLCWGVNDFDEAADLPYTQDLVRLAASARFAHKGGALDVKLAGACAAILDGYRECLADGGRPFVLEESHPHLRALAMAADRDPAAFWSKLAGLLDDPPADPPPEPRAVLAAALPPGCGEPAYRARRAGVGSLGRPRYVALTRWAGSWLCREAKAAAPPATAWATGTDAPCRAGEAATRSVRAPDPFYRLAGRWVVRRLGPRSSRIESSGLKAADTGRLLHAMGAEAGNVHLGTAGAAADILKDLGTRPAGWLAEAAREMADRIEADWHSWQEPR